MTGDDAADAREVRLDAFARALKDVFGDRAPDVARRQAEMADADADHVATWREILVRLEG